MASDHLISRLYEAAALPELWPDVLSELSGIVGHAGCTLITVDDGLPRWMSNPQIDAMVREYFASGWADRNDRVARSLHDRQFGCVRDIDIYSREEIETMPLVRDFLRPRGFGWGAAILNTLPAGEFIMLSIERQWSAGPVPDAAVELMHEIQPHLMRSALLSAKLQFERAKAAVETFGLASIPAALVRSSGKVMAANDLFLGLGGRVRIGREDLLWLSSPAARALLSAALRRLPAEGGRRAPQSIAIAATDEARPLVLHVLPAEGAARDLFGMASALILVTQVDAPAPPSPGLLHALFDLTPSEARVANALLSGGSTADIASSIGIGQETVRTHLKAILRKTGFQRRMEFALFMSGVSKLERR